MSEAELTERCRHGEKSAQKELYQQYAGILYALCIRYAGDREVAKDLLHDGFLKVYTSFDRFVYRGEGSLRAWLSRVMVNTVLEYLRKSEKMNMAIPLDEVPDIPDEEEDLSLVPRNVIMQYISELPAGYRTVFNLYTFEEKSHKEIASLLGINEKSSSSQLHRAKAILVKRVKEYINRYEYETGR